MSTIHYAILCFGVKLSKEFTDEYDLDDEHSDLVPDGLKLVRVGGNNCDPGEQILALDSGFYETDSDSTLNPLMIHEREMPFDQGEWETLRDFCNDYSVLLTPRWWLGHQSC